MRLKLKELTERLDKEITKAGRVAIESKKSSDEASGGLAASYSAAGDAEHSRNTALLSLQKLDLLKKLKDEVNGAMEDEVPQTVTPLCFVSIESDSGRKSDFYFVKNSAYLAGVSLISIDSPLGRAILGKRNGDTFSYTTGDQEFSGLISGID